MASTATPGHHAPARLSLQYQELVVKISSSVEAWGPLAKRLLAVPARTANSRASSMTMFTGLDQSWIISGSRPVASLAACS